MSDAGGLRERKKRQTRETIAREALQLFRERGFDGVTVADIAAASNIAPRTFFAYFPTKEDVVFADHEQALDGFSALLREREDAESTIDALRRWIADLLADHDPDDPAETCRKELIRGTPSLAAQRLSKMSEFEHVLREGIARDLGDDPDGMRPRLVAAAAVAALMSLDELDADHWELLGSEDPLEVLDVALAFLRGGLDALQSGDRRPHSR
ncbi:TetR family transcriptional regulator [Paraconexibacter algicola]|uniref:TetR family transcriptional regulator n=1 Tax=Paraconexibacter algicola TaxID=2133960 RepID=A0A2T4UF55_9ACTN|nr:TetR family transcriptional regulator [Paraconexibacter algicola]PTL56408.1 TetR family transcriptional regulator [Paraconexibacter algicola]